MELALSFDPLALQFAGATTWVSSGLRKIWGVGPWVWSLGFRGLRFLRLQVLVASEALRDGLIPQQIPGPA